MIEKETAPFNRRETNSGHKQIGIKDGLKA